jgi:hypothetical protein
MIKIINKGLWLLIFFLAILIGLYALSVGMISATRSPFVSELIQNSFSSSLLHILGGGIVIIFGAAQFSQRLRSKRPTIHRWMGYVYIAGVFVGGLAALNLSLYSSGGLVAHFGFGALAIIWLVSTAIAFNKIRQRKIIEHQRWMIRSYALTLAALTLRIYLPIALISGIPFEEVYPLIAWICWVPNILIAEWLLLPKLTKSHSG